MANQAKLARFESITDEAFVQDVADEVRRARKLHAAINSAHEGYAVILEEVREFETEVFKKRDLRDRKAMYEELVQIAAMACRTAADVLGDMRYA